MKTAISPGWREAAATAMSRVLQRLDDSSKATSREAPQQASRPQPVVVEPVQRVELPPLDFRTGQPVVTKAELPKPAPMPKPVEKVARIVEKVSVLEDPARQRIRDAYVAARFAGVARTSHDLAHTRHVIKSAHHYFEDGNTDRAEELLDLAAELQPSCQALWLARLELALRLRDASGYRRTALLFRHHHPNSPRWKEIVAFARTVCITEAPFIANVADMVGDNAYQRPAWVHDSWELAPEFMPADLRTRVLGTTAKAESSLEGAEAEIGLTLEEKEAA